MIPMKNKQQSFRSRVLMACAGILVMFLLLSCPNPIDSKLANQVEDDFAPLVTIIAPDPAVKYYYPSTIDIVGTVQDFVDQAGGTAGTIVSLTYEEQFDKRIAGTIDVASDGSFSFTIDALLLEGTQYIVISAVDWNDNVTEIVITAYDKTTGPPIGADIDYTGYTSNPAVGLTYTITGVVGSAVGFLTVTYDVEPEFGADILNRPINPVAGAFSFDFNPSAEGVSGELKFILKATDVDGTNTYTFYLYDDPDPPAYDVASAVTADNTYVDLIFSEGIYHTGGTAPLATDFGLGWSGGSGSVTDVVLGGFIGTPAAGDTSVRMALAVTGTPAGDETLTITGSNLTDAVGNPLTPASLNRNLTDKIAPVVTQVGVQSGYEDDTYNHLDPALPIPIIVTFDGPVTVTPPLSLALNSGASVSYSGGGGTSALTFNYTIADGDNTPPATALNYTGTTALTGSVTDSGGNTVVNPTLPDPAGLMDLGEANIVIDTTKPNAPVITILDGDGKITKSENDADVPFTITGEAGTNYALASDASWELEAGSMNGTLPVSGLELRAKIISGTVTVSATLTDAAGNTSAPGLDTSEASLLAPYPPDFVIGPHAVNDPAALDWVWETGGSGLYVGNGNYRYKVNDPDLTTGALTQTDTSGNVYYSDFVPDPVVDGSYTLYVQEENNLNNWSDSASCELILDRVDPVVTAPASVTVEATQDHGMSSTWTSNYYGSASVSDDRDASPDLTILVDGGAPPSALGVGYHDVTFTGTDHAGNTHVVARTVTVMNTVTAPAGGEKWVAGTDHNVTWRHDGSGTATVSLYKGGVLAVTLKSGTNDDGSTTCTIPASSTPGADYTIQVTDDTTGMVSESGQFTVEKVTVTSPNGGETWGIGSSHSITWTSSGTGNVRIVLRKGGSNLSPDLASSTANDGSYSWTISESLSADTDYRIRVIDIDTSNADTSNADFTLEEITVTSPNGGESWKQGSKHDITWDGSGGGNVKIELVQGGNPLVPAITTSTANIGSFEWDIAADQAVGEYFIRVTSIEAPTVSDDSDAAFSVVP
jgi:hypothetical protein